MEIGAVGEASLTVRLEDTAQALSKSAEDVFPAVFATARMVALMELAAARVMRPFLQEGQLSVGVSVAIEHTAATPIGSVVRALAIYRGAEGRLYRFDIEAFDEAGSIGAGTHTRATVSTERLLAGAARRRS